MSAHKKEEELIKESQKTVEGYRAEIEALKAKATHYRGGETPPSLLARSPPGPSKRRAGHEGIDTGGNVGVGASQGGERKQEKHLLQLRRVFGAEDQVLPEAEKAPVTRMVRIGPMTGREQVAPPLFEGVQGRLHQSSVQHTDILP
ncbi:MAG: hypothetical protein IE886_08510 [Campylobacterales bacterium]|nr:hypothetical protein [Campylobacterales bacterium]